MKPKADGERPVQATREPLRKNGPAADVATKALKATRGVGRMRDLRHLVNDAGTENDIRQLRKLFWMGRQKLKYGCQISFIGNPCRYIPGSSATPPEEQLNLDSACVLREASRKHRRSPIGFALEERGATGPPVESNVSRTQLLESFECMGLYGIGQSGPKADLLGDTAAFREDQKADLSELPFRKANGSRIHPEDVKEAVRFIAERGIPGMKEFWMGQQEMLRALDANSSWRARLMMPELVNFRQRLRVGHYSTRAKLRIPELAALLVTYGMGGRARRRQFIQVFQILGDPAGTCVYLVSLFTGRPTAKEEMFKEATSRVTSERKKSGADAAVGGRGSSSRTRAA